MSTKQKIGITGSARDGVLEELCSRKATTLLATPYLSFESRLLEREGERLHIRATMGREVALNTLSKHPLKLRFPWDLSFYSGATRILGYEQGENRRYLVVEVPETLVPDEMRREYRADRVGKSQGALGTAAGPEVTILQVSLENLSAGGAGVFLKDYRAVESFMPGHSVQVSLELEGGPEFNALARICHSNGPYLGLEFTPPLSEPALGSVRNWVEARQQDAQRLWENRAELRAQALEAARPKAPPSGLLLLTADPVLAAQIKATLEDTHGLRSFPPVMAPYKAALSQRPLVLILDTSCMGSEERRRTRTLLEAQPPGCPIIVLGRDTENEHPRTLALELKQATYLEWTHEKAGFLRILVQGLIRKHWKAEG